MSDNHFLKKSMLSPSMFNRIKSPKSGNNTTSRPSAQNTFYPRQRKSSQGNNSQEIMNFNVNLNFNLNLTGQKNQNLNLNTSINLNPKNQKSQKITFDNYKNITNVGQSMYVQKLNNDKVPSFLNKNKEKQQKLNSSLKNQQYFPFSKLQAMGKFAKTDDSFSNTSLSSSYRFQSKEQFERFGTFSASDGLEMKKKLKTQNNTVFQSYMPQTERQYVHHPSRKDSFYQRSKLIQNIQEKNSNKKIFKKKCQSIPHSQKHWPSSMHQIALSHFHQLESAHSLQTIHKRQDNNVSPGKKIKQQNQYKQFWKKKNTENIQNIQNAQKQLSSKKGWTIDDFQLFDKIGKGAHGDVFLSRQKVSGFICVIKKLSKKRIKQQKIQHHVIRQLKIQSYLKHRHLTNLFGFFWDQNYIYLILELMADGNISHFIKRKKKTSELLTAHLIKQTIQCLKYMHTQNIIHRDLKPQNVFIHEDYVKVGDLGCAVECNSMRSTVIGSLAYVSPQQLQSNGYDQKIDIWSIGILTYELLFGKPPFEEDVIKIAKGQKEVKLSKLNFPQPSIQNKIPQISDEAKDFIRQLLQQNPKDRIDMKKALKHPFLKKYEKDQSLIFQQINMC